ncbi:MAG TPA: type I-MYXAN CRISPR-associated protein Cas6/Cmx6 [Rhodocyclaceae bacterium]|nr:type I-MYXAN CRISPR-associated protein Cas6/Cmx6 [Rhodocyclaceae bacterium]
MNTEADDAVDVVNIVDVGFGLDGRAVALDYADRLLQGLLAELPWLAGENRVGVHPLAGVSAGNTELYLTRRARLSLRLPSEYAEAVRRLSGRKLDLGGEVRIVGEPSEKPLAPAKVLYSSFVTVGEQDEERFLAACRQQLVELGIGGQMICGKAKRGSGANELWHGFSLMLHDLPAEQSLRLQQEGIGSERKRGCGIFVPHKALAAVVD